MIVIEYIYIYTYTSIILTSSQFQESGVTAHDWLGYCACSSWTPTIGSTRLFRSQLTVDPWIISTLCQFVCWLNPKQLVQLAMSNLVAHGWFTWFIQLSARNPSWFMLVHGWPNENMLENRWPKTRSHCQELVKQEMEVDRRHDEQLLALQQVRRSRCAGFLSSWWSNCVSFKALREMSGISQVPLTLQSHEVNLRNMATVPG